MAGMVLAVEVGATTTDTLLIHPAKDDSLLLNPGKGYVQYYGADDPYTKDYIGVGYNRWCWSAIEPTEGQFNWKVIDDFIQQFGRHGKQSAIAVMSVSTGIGMEYVTPKWVFDAGASALEIPDSTAPGGRQFIPRTWDDPVFLQKLHQFIRAFGARYDGNTHLAFLDIRDYGNWGEGHIGFLTGATLATPEILKSDYLQPYVAAFPHTQLIMTWGADLYNGIYDWGITQGMGIRRDGILSEWSKDGSECLRAYGHAPAVFEYCDSYETTKKKGFWNTNLLMKYIQAGKPTYMQWDPKIFLENREFILQLGNRIGYHFVLQQATVPATIKLDKPFSLEWQWFNDGVAPLYGPCQVAVALLDQNNQVVEKQWLPDSSPRNWKPDESTTEKVSARFSSVPEGKYKLAVGLFLDRRADLPAFRVGIQGRTDQGWYVLSEIIVSPPASL